MKKRTISLAIAALLLTALLSACGGSKSSNYDASYAAEMAVEAAYDYDYEYDGYWAEPEEAAAPVPMPNEAASRAQNGAKLIYTANVSMETLDFDAAVDSLDALTAESGGYFESSSVSDQGSTRSADYTIRVPAENYRDFLDRAGDLCHVLSLREYTEDVSEAYYDTSGRLETQKTKLARLQELLTEAESMEDIIAIESAISETEEMIDWLSGTLRHYDALVDYSTVTLSLREVKVYEPEPDPTFGSRLSAAFTNGLKGFAEGLGDIVVVLAYTWLWLLLIAGIVIVIVVIAKKRRASRPPKQTAPTAPAYSVPVKKDGEPGFEKEDAP